MIQRASIKGNRFSIESHYLQHRKVSKDDVGQTPMKIVSVIEHSLGLLLLFWSGILQNP